MPMRAPSLLQRTEHIEAQAEDAERPGKGLVRCPLALVKLAWQAHGSLGRTLCPGQWLNELPEGPGVDIFNSL